MAEKVVCTARDFRRNRKMWMSFAEIHLKSKASVGFRARVPVGKDHKNGVSSSMLDYSYPEVLPAGFPTLKKAVEAICRQMCG